MGAATFDLEVWVDGQEKPIEVRADQRDLAAFERAHKIGTPQALETMTMIFFRYIAWAALRRQGLTNQVFDDWDKSAISVEPMEDGENGSASPGSPAA